MDTTSLCELQAAFEELADSQRGIKCMKNLGVFLRCGGIGLDNENQQAVLTLLSGAFGSHPGTVLEMLSEI